jgi:glycosyltransferase involved in cell wall biosynthesis
MGAVLRMGGYRGPIVAVEHGMLLLEQQGIAARHPLRRISRVGGAWAADAEVAVSDFMLDRMCRHSHAHRTQRIYNGIDPAVCLPALEARSDRGLDLVVGFMGRLVPGKGTDHIIRALAQASRQISVKLLIAGDGPERSRLASLAHDLGADPKIEFLGIVRDLPSFWRRCDVAAVPSETLESFSMVTLEAMACGTPIIATQSGAIPELVIDSATGTLVPPSDVGALAKALILYAEHPKLRSEHGAAARARAIEHFHIEDCARAYLDLFAELAANPAG